MIHNSLFVSSFSLGFMHFSKGNENNVEVRRLSSKTIFEVSNGSRRIPTKYVKNYKPNNVTFLGTNIY